MAFLLSAPKNPTKEMRMVTTPEAMSSIAPVNPVSESAIAT